MKKNKKKDGKQRRFTNPIEAIGLFAFRILIERGKLYNFNETKTITLL